MSKFFLAIIGGGPAGYTAAEKASKAGKDVVLFEQELRQQEDWGDGRLMKSILKVSGIVSKILHLQMHYLCWHMWCKFRKNGALISHQRCAHFA